MIDTLPLAWKDACLRDPPGSVDDAGARSCGTDDSIVRSSGLMVQFCAAAELPLSDCPRRVLASVMVSLKHEGVLKLVRDRPAG
jgi:hypothetical protein